MPHHPSQSDSSGFEAPSPEEMNVAISQYDFREMFQSDRTGALYRAWQDNLDRDVCIKVMPPGPKGMDTAEFIAVFENEARMMARLSHPNIVKVYDFGRTGDGLAYFVMEYVEGDVLYRMIRAGEVTLDHVFEFIPQVCTALDYAHDRSVVHCDIRPANILMTKNRRITVANFGFSTVRGRSARTSATVSATSLAAVDYMAPEIREGQEDIDGRADVYSVGIMIYEMLTGVVPRGAWKPASEVVGTDPRFDEIIEKAMAPDREHRYQAAGEIAAALTRPQAGWFRSRSVW
ncbi:MAG: serine/threonine protein kinase [Verrucomicrobiales bacterium]|nr:serine/threonine protein kinase [Verrucomicrobiales bacterium]